ncbi:hypothetical protein ZIOFF_044330 [Zingiber officinale]|uniref:Uncharacterized protein n=1 Tax=Zingiber officinale TaxID=94328 RepID=A0A8J5KR52_ZINOF|nr:hypothetical protein ZIOFF_044330 [Zingiber officinale]
MMGLGGVDPARGARPGAALCGSVEKWECEVNTTTELSLDSLSLLRPTLMCSLRVPKNHQEFENFLQVASRFIRYFFGGVLVLGPVAYPSSSWHRTLRYGECDDADWKVVERSELFSSSLRSLIRWFGGKWNEAGDEDGLAGGSEGERRIAGVQLPRARRCVLAEVLQFRIDEEMPIADLLADGELLFQVSKVVWKRLLKNHAELRNSKLFIYEHTSFARRNSRYMPYPKVDSFLKRQPHVDLWELFELAFEICQILGLTGIDLFSPSDVVEKRDIRRVSMCVRSFSKKARLKGLSKGFECGYESDEAESSYNELEFESPSSHVSFHAACMLNLDPEDYPQRRSVEDEFFKVHGYLELEDQTHNEDSHKNNQHEKNILLESTDSTFGGIIQSDSSKSSFSSHEKSPQEVPARLEDQYQTFNVSIPKTCLTEQPTFDSLIDTVPANGHIKERFADMAVENLSSIIEKHDDMAYERWLRHEDHQNGIPICIIQFDDDSKTSCCSSADGCTSPEGSVVDESIPSTLCETSHQTRSDIARRNCVSTHDLYCGNVHGSLETGEGEGISDSKVVCDHCSRDLVSMEFMGIYHANEVTSDWSYISGSHPASESADHIDNFLPCVLRESGDDSFCDWTNLSCSKTGILRELKGGISAEENLEIEDGVHFIKDVVTIRKLPDPDDTKEREKIMEGYKKNLASTSTTSEAKVGNTGKRVLKSLAGSVTLIGALLVFLHLRRKRERERSSHTVLPLPAQETYQEVYTNKKVEINNYDKRYPGERLKL